MDRQCKKNNNNLHMDRQCKKNNRQFTYGQTVQKNNNRQFTYGQTVQKTALEHLQCSRQCKKNNNSNLHMDRQCKKKNNSNLHMDSTYLQTVQKTMCKIHIHILIYTVYYKDILNYQRHIIHRMGTSALCTVSIHNVIYA